MRLPILLIGSPILRLVAAPVRVFDESLRTLAANMIETMVVANGIGLAAPQIGRSLRMIVVGLSDAPQILVNPRIVKRADWQRSEEGCLSVPRELWSYPIMRAKRITVEYHDLDGNDGRMKAAGFMATVLEHEIDHLDGILFTDYARKDTAYGREVARLAGLDSGAPRDVPQARSVREAVELDAKARAAGARAGGVGEGTP